MSSPTRADDLDPTLMYAPPWVRRQGQSWPDAASSPPVDRAWREHLGNGQRPNGVPTLTETERRLSLEPERFPEPLQSSVDSEPFWKIMLRAAGVVGFAALIAGLAVLVLSAKQPEQAGLPAISIPTNSRDPIPASDAAKTRADGLHRQVNVSAMSAQESASGSDFGGQPPSTALAVATMSRVPQVKLRVPVPTVTTREPSRAPLQAAPDFVTRQLDRGELASMLQRADGFLKSGDLSSARLLLRRAAEAGDARAAFMLAGTFDPNLLKTLGLPDAAPDLPQARLWYDRAAKLGSADAARHLRRLVTASAQ